MKRLATLCLLLCGVLPAYSQLVITDSDVQALVGTSQEYASYSTDGPASTILALIDTDGPNQTWDFTTLTFDEGPTEVFTYATEAPADAPGRNEAPFNQADHVLIQEIGTDSTNYAFSDLRADGIYYFGNTSAYGSSLEARIAYQPPILSLPLPATYGNTWTSNATFIFTGGGITYDVQETRANEIDGYGTLILPHGSFEVLRQKQTITATTSFGSTTQTLYFFYTNTFESVGGLLALDLPFGAGTVYLASYRAAPGGGGTTNPPATAPMNLSPADGADEQPTTLTLSWSPVDGATGFDLQVATDSGFKTASTAVVVDETGLTETSFEVNGLDDGAMYVWRVRGTNEAGPGPWSSEPSFTTATELTVPAQVMLTAPEDGATDLETTVTLSWEATATAATYHLQVATDDAFTSLMVDDASLTTTEYALNDLDPSTTYYWQVSASNSAGDGPFSATRSFTTMTNTAIERDAASVPETFHLYANYPNPFNPSTEIRFDLKQAVTVSLVVTDVSGRVVAHLVDEPLPAGTYRYAFDASHLASGLYLYRLTAGSRRETRPMMLVK